MARSTDLLHISMVCSTNVRMSVIGIKLWVHCSTALDLVCSRRICTMSSALRHGGSGSAQKVALRRRVLLGCVPIVVAMEVVSNVTVLVWMLTCRRCLEALHAVAEVEVVVGGEAQWRLPNTESPSTSHQQYRKSQTRDGKELKRQGSSREGEVVGRNWLSILK